MPIIDAPTMAGRSLHSDVCVVGGGPAGIVVASELSSAGLNVIVLEAGTAPYDRHTLRNAALSMSGHVWGAQSGARGRNLGRPYYPLRMSRARGVGGSSQALKNHGLRSRPLDAIDFSAAVGDRWPLPYAEYESLLAPAADYCGIPGDDLSWDAWQPAAWNGSVSDVTALGFRHGQRDAFWTRGVAGGARTAQRWILGAAATELLVDASGHVDAVVAASRAGTDFVVRADTVVLAAGGIDNPRLLLVTERVLGHMGTAADQVGRYFMEHLHYVAGYLRPSSAEARRSFAGCFARDDRGDPWLTLADDVIVGRGIARTAYAAVPAHVNSLDPAVRAFGRIARMLPFGPFDKATVRREVRDVARGGTAVPRAMVERILGSSAPEVFALTAMTEQEPNPLSRVSLGVRRDRYGLRLPTLDWQLTEGDLRTVRTSAEILGENLRAAGLGRFVPAAADAGPMSAVFTGGWHHMGTTRMSVDPRFGVVDSDCRVHGTSNLFVAGSSVFPSGGFANPTLSIVALAIRLARHIANADISQRTAGPDRHASGD